jgi:cation:H+ antiporter
VVGSQLLVDSAIAIATLLGASPLLIGLTVVAVGTSLPELATSVTASLRGESDIAVGNVVGSNIFNVLIVLGLSSSTAPGGIVVPPAAISFDIPIMIAVALMCFPICFTASRISRKEGILLLVCYVLYTSYLVASAGVPSSSLLSGLSRWIGFGTVSLTLLAAVVTALQSSKAMRHKRLQ